MYELVNKQLAGLQAHLAQYIESRQAVATSGHRARTEGVSEDILAMNPPAEHGTADEDQDILAMNPPAKHGDMTDPQERFEAYVKGVVDKLRVWYEADADTALNALMEAAFTLTQRGLLPELPEDQTDKAGTQAWVDSAESVGLSGAAFILCQQMQEASSTVGGEA